MTTSCFVVRPFGKKGGIDFDRVQEVLLNPAMERLELRGGTTAEIAYAGNIRADMFELLAKSDLVIADISIHNANVFYELGARHALRDKRTFLIRCRSDVVPFDLKTDRYLVYDKEAPERSVDDLVKGLRQTIEAGAKDSPIFQLVPNLEPQDWTRLVAVPGDFRDEVHKAQRDKHPGDLELLSLEARALEWALEGLRLVGQAQFDLKAWEGARHSWEAVRKRLEGDLQADLKLATIYQKLGDMASSDSALARAVENPHVGDRERAEAYALLGSNEKTRWLEGWKHLPVEKRAERALGSAHLQDALTYYADGFAADLNHFYSGFNALALHTVVTELAKAHPDVWAIDFEDDEDEQASDRALRKVEKTCRRLEGAVDLSVERKLKGLKNLGQRDVWAEITQADLTLLTSCSPKRVTRAYQRALGNAKDFDFASVRRQIDMYLELGVLTENANAALEEIERLEQQTGISPKKPTAEETHILLFTGHRIDAPDRAAPRFPIDKEALARDVIKEAVMEEQANISGALCGMAGGASGGDLLFHEVCAELGIPTRLYLAIPSESYIVASVDVLEQPQWIDRFRAVEKCCSPRILSRNKELPNWLRSRPDYSIWQRNNLWTLHNALAHGGKNVTLIALWDGDVGDGPGGTEDMVRQAKARGAKVIVLDTGKLFGL